MTETSDSVTLTLDGAQQQGFISLFDSLPEKSSTTFRIFDRNEYYTMHGSDALFVAKEIFKTTGVIKYLGSGSKKLESIALSRLKFEAVVRELLLVFQYRVEVYKNQATAKNQNWLLDLAGSPGNLTDFEDLLFGNSDMSTSAGVMAIKVTNENGQQVVGIAYTDAMQRKFIVSQFPDNDQFTNLEVILVQLGPKECLLPPIASSPELAKVKQVIERNKILITERKKSEFVNKDIVADLNRLLKFKKGEQGNSATLPEMDNVNAMCSLAVIIKYFDLIGEEAYFGQYTMSMYNLQQFVKLDAALVNALNLFPAPDQSNKSHSIFGILNKCRTASGQRMLAQWIKQPLTDINKINERLDVVEALVEDSSVRCALHDDHLRRLPDFQRLSKKLLRKKANLQDCYRIYQAIDRIPHLLEDLEKYDGKHKTVLTTLFINPIKELIVDFMKYQEMIEATMDLAQADNNEYLIKPDFDENLSDLRVKINGLEEEIEKQLPKVARQLGLEAGKTIKLESNSQLGYFFRITRKEEKVLRNKSDLKTIDTNKNGIRFTNSYVQSMNAEFVECRQEYNEHQSSIVCEVIGIASGYCQPLQQLSQVSGHLDALVSLSIASLSAPASYVRPTILPKGSGIIKLKQARHPCLELQDNMSYIANDVHFHKDQHMFHIITGPNMGGKSTYIRSAGVVVLMAQIGCFVPCEEAHVSIVDSIMARVGAADCQLKGVSTFMTEMLETATILQSATSDSLIIIDELGRGTSTYDGFGLAWSISKHLATKVGAYCLFATHFHELTTLADQVPTVNNLHVAAMTTNHNLTLLYQIQQGVCDQSFGIHIAQLAHFPDDVINNAKKKITELEDFQREVIGGTEYDGEDESCVKKRKIAKQQGELIIQDFLKAVSQLKKSSASDEDIRKQVQSLKDDIQSRNNPYIQSILLRGA